MKVLPYILPIFTLKVSAGAPGTQILCSQSSVTGSNSNETPSFTQCYSAAKRLASVRARSGTANAATLVEDTSFAEAFNVDSSGESKPDPRFGLKIRIPVINHYGCWCYGGEFWPGARDQTGYGPVMDVWDDICKAHHMGFDCIAKDADVENKVCNPTETPYTLLISPQSNGDYLVECADDIEQDWCKAKVCMVDLRFLARHWTLEADGLVPDYASFGHPGYHENQGSFDTMQCAVTGNSKSPGTGSGNPRNQVCCGDYPYRVWYDRNNNANLKCCAVADVNTINDYGFYLETGKLYNDNHKKCCLGGVVSINDQCPDISQEISDSKNLG